VEFVRGCFDWLDPVVLDADGVGVVSSARESMVFPELRGTVIYGSDIDGVGEKIVCETACAVEVSAVRRFCVREVKALVPAVVGSTDVDFN